MVTEDDEDEEETIVVLVEFVAFVLLAAADAAALCIVSEMIIGATKLKPRNRSRPVLLSGTPGESKLK